MYSSEILISNFTIIEKLLEKLKKNDLTFIFNQESVKANIYYTCLGINYDDHRTALCYNLIKLLL